MEALEEEPRNKDLKTQKQASTRALKRKTGLETAQQMTTMKEVICHPGEELQNAETL